LRSPDGADGAAAAAGGAAAAAGVAGRVGGADDGGGAAGAGGAGLPAILASRLGHPASARTRAKSGSDATSGAVPRSTIRASITSASPGRPLSDCARASRNINAGSLGLPFWTARHARSWKASASPRAAASVAMRRHSAASPHDTAGIWRTKIRTANNKPWTADLGRFDYAPAAQR
jgi:hypothetical protein